MKYIISGTNRPNSRSMQLSKKIQTIYSELGSQAEIIDLRELGLSQADGSQYAENRPDAVQKAVDQVVSSQGLIFVVPEYNGSYPGVLKYFVDHWGFPDAFEFRPCCFVGLGGQFAGLRPVEHLQQVMAYRNAFLYPKRVFVSNVWSKLDKDGEFMDVDLLPRLTAQAEGFIKFIDALESAKIDANSVLKTKG